MSEIKTIKSLLQKFSNLSKNKTSNFFKTAVGHYAEHDQFIDVSVPNLRKIAKEFSKLSLAEIQKLLESKINEERLLALLILNIQYQKAAIEDREKIYQFYLKNLKQINNWNLVDSSAHLIIGAHLLNQDKTILLTLAKSEIMWYRRIAIIATWYFIRNSNLEWTFKIAKILLNDQHDLIHKAVGWMLREAGKKDQEQLIKFLNQYATQMPRTMLRYAIEKFPDDQRKGYLKLK
jgi:3-methyladenine DNA glycosylase AlkD